MRALALTAFAAVALSACTSGKTNEKPTEAATQAQTQTQEQPQTSPPVVLAQGPEMPPPPPLPGKILVPPPQNGEAVTQVSGCLAAATPSESDGAAFPAKPDVPTRGGPSAPKPPEVMVATTGGGIVVEHALTHACCLKSETKTTVEAARVSITETLSGMPCRCRCASTLKTAVGLVPGTYTVVVTVDDHGNLRVAYDGQITVH